LGAVPLEAVTVYVAVAGVAEEFTSVPVIELPPPAAPPVIPPIIRGADQL
jgi:hypothetical protein